MPKTKQVDSDNLQIDKENEFQISFTHKEEEMRKSLPSLSKAKEPEIPPAVHSSCRMLFFGGYSHVRQLILQDTDISQQTKDILYQLFEEYEKNHIIKFK